MVFIWIEHYEDRVRSDGKFTLKEHFDRVFFTLLADSNGLLSGFSHPHWRRISSENVEAHIGHSITLTLQLA